MTEVKVQAPVNLLKIANKEMPAPTKGAPSKPPSLLSASAQTTKPVLDFSKSYPIEGYTPTKAEAMPPTPAEAAQTQQPRPPLNLFRYVSESRPEPPKADQTQPEKAPKQESVAPATPEKSHKDARREMTQAHGSVVKAIQADRRQFDQRSATAPTQHTVKNGQTSWEIAKANNLSLAQLKALNPDVNDLGKIKPGQTLNLTRQASELAQPAPASAPAATPATPSSAPAAAGTPVAIPLPQAEIIKATGNPTADAKAVADANRDGSIAYKDVEYLQPQLKPFSDDKDKFIARAHADIAESEKLAGSTPDGFLSREELVRLYGGDADKAGKFIQAFDGIGVGNPADGKISREEAVAYAALQMDPTRIQSQIDTPEFDKTEFKADHIAGRWERLFVDTIVEKDTPSARQAASQAFNDVFKAK